MVWCPHGLGADVPSTGLHLQGICSTKPCPICWSSMGQPPHGERQIAGISGSSSPHGIAALFHSHVYPHVLPRVLNPQSSQNHYDHRGCPNVIPMLSPLTPQNIWPNDPGQTSHGIGCRGLPTCSDHLGTRPNEPWWWGSNGSLMYHMGCMDI